MRQVPFLVFVIPCYNEEEILPKTFDALASLLRDLKSSGDIDEKSFTLYVNDGSCDRTWELIESRAASDTFVHGVCFARNAGHQNAVWAGMESARRAGCDCIISLDADLQDDISVVKDMVAEYRKGCEIVYGVRNDRTTDTSFKRNTAEMFYGFMKLLNVNMVPDHADYRLVSRRVLEELRQFHEHELFLRGLFPTLGFKTAKVYYKRQKREAGVSKYPLFKMIAFAWKGITSCSVAPLRLAGLMSVVCAILAVILSVRSVACYFLGYTVSGWTSTMIVVLFLGAIQLLCLSLIGEYIAKIYTEVRNRPRYIIEKEI